LDYNKLSGSIPDSIGELINLERIYLFANELTGSIPSSMGYLTKLWRFDLHSNTLTGEIPGSLIALQPGYIELDHNKLSGRVPRLRVRAISVCDLSYNPSLCRDADFNTCGNLPSMFDIFNQR
jgi:hypothetical protein